MARKASPKFKVGDPAFLPYGVHPPAPLPCIPAESTVTVQDVAVMRGKEETRYRVQWSGVVVWVYESDLREKGEPEVPCCVACGAPINGDESSVETDGRERHADCYVDQ